MARPHAWGSATYLSAQPPSARSEGRLCRQVCSGEGVAPLKPLKWLPSWPLPTIVPPECQQLCLKTADFEIDYYLEHAH